MYVFIVDCCFSFGMYIHYTGYRCQYDVQYSTDCVDSISWSSCRFCIHGSLTVIGLVGPLIACVVNKPNEDFVYLLLLAEVM